MKRIILILLFLVLCGCTADYDLNYIDNEFHESFSFSSMGLENNSIYNIYKNNNIISDYRIDVGDLSESVISSYNNLYNKSINNELFKINYTFSNEYKYSTVVNQLFRNIYISDNEIRANSCKDVFDKYNMLDQINISFKTDKYVIDSNCDEVRDNTYYWYINKNNYKSKTINISFSDKKIYKINKIDEEYADDVINLIIIVIGIFVLIGILVIYEKIKRAKI